MFKPQFCHIVILGPILSIHLYFNSHALRHGDLVSTRIRLPCVALQSCRRTDEGAGVAAVQSDDTHHLPGRRLHIRAELDTLDSRRHQLTSASSNVVSFRSRHVYTICHAPDC